MTPQNAWLPGHANTDPDIRFWWLFEEGPRAVFSLEVDEFRNPASGAISVLAVSPLPFARRRSRCADRRDTLLAAAQQDCTLQR
jgi:hypothetical protein